MGVKYMKTSELVAWICKSFTYGFLGFQTTENRDMKLQSNTSYMAIKNLIKLREYLSYKYDTGLLQD